MVREQRHGDSGPGGRQRVRRRRAVQRRHGSRGGFYLFTIRDSTNGDSSVQDLAENHLDGEFYGTFPSGNGINGGDFVAELQAFHNKIFAPQTIIGTANAANGGVGGKRSRCGAQRRLRAGDPARRQPDLLDARQPGDARPRRRLSSRSRSSKHTR